MRWCVTLSVAVFVLALVLYWFYTATRTVVAATPAQLDAVRWFLASDADGFVATFTNADFHARGAPDRASYCALAARAVRAPSSSEANRLRAALANASPTLKRLPATIVVLGSEVEGGMPHTRGATIFVSPSVIQMSTIPQLTHLLNHELTHVAQRRRPADARSWAVAHGYVQRRDRRRHPLSRANPDLDGVQWDGPDGAPVAFLYRGPRPIGLSDGEVVGGEYEHPYEAQAYHA